MSVLNIKRWIRLVLSLCVIRFQIVFFHLPDFQFRTKHRYLLYTVLWCIFLSAILFFSKSDYTDVTVLKVQFNNSCLNFFIFPHFVLCNVFFQIWFHREAQSFGFILKQQKNRFCFAYNFPSELISALCFRFVWISLYFHVFDAFCLFKIRWIFRSVTFFLNASCV
jgi:hypothetical protein